MTFTPMQLPNPQIISLFLRGSGGMSSYATAVMGTPCSWSGFAEKESFLF